MSFRARAATFRSANWGMRRHSSLGTSGLAPAFTCRISMPVPSQMSQGLNRSEEHTSELQSLMRISYAVFCLKKTIKHKHKTTTNLHTTPKVIYTNTYIDIT